MPLSTLFARPATALFNQLFHLLHNRTSTRLSREEIRLLNISFSQFGEDLIVSQLAHNLGIENGFYVDAGAFHPIHCSNTLLLHKQGWSGVNIDLSPEKVALFDELRPGDTNIEALLSDGEKDVHIFYKGGLVDRIVSSPADLPPAEAAQLRPATTQTLTRVLHDHGIGDRPIDYLNIDCEGHDLPVLRGLDLDRYPVTILTIEALDKESEAAIQAYTSDHGLRFRGKHHWTLLFARDNSSS